MSILSPIQRDVIRADTKINALVIDRVADAFDALISRGDVDAYTQYMKTAIVQMAYDRPIRPQDRPTAVDIVKTICIKAYADEKHISFQRAAVRLREMLKG
jgi:hypothetical protein